MAAFWCANFDGRESILERGLQMGSWMMQYEYDVQERKDTSRNWNRIREIKVGDWLVAYLKGERFFAVGQVITPRKQMTHEDTINATVARHTHKYRDGIIYYYNEVSKDKPPVFYEDFTDEWCIQNDKQLWYYRQRIDVAVWENIVREAVTPSVLGSDPQRSNYALSPLDEVQFERIKVELQKKACPVSSYPHIEIRPDGKAWLTGTQTKVLEVALNRIAHHWDADEIHRQHPHLALGQIYSCLAYYHDHEQEMDQIIEEQLQNIKRLRAQQGESALHAKLRAKGLAS